MYLILGGILLKMLAEFFFVFSCQLYRKVLGSPPKYFLSSISLNGTHELILTLCQQNPSQWNSTNMQNQLIQKKHRFFWTSFRILISFEI